MDFDRILDLPVLRTVTEPIDNIINCFLRIAIQIFRGGNSGYLNNLVNTIVTNPYLLVSVSLVIIGFVIGILKRIISV